MLLLVRDVFDVAYAKLQNVIGYEVESNKEKGLGRPDILLKDEDHRRAIIIEAKKSDKEADLDKDCDEAIGYHSQPDRALAARSRCEICGLK